MLPYNDVVVAERMGINKSNFSSYINGHKPITINFLKKFYEVHGREINELRQQQDDTCHEASIVYKVSDQDAISQLNEKYNTLENKYNQLMESHQQISAQLRFLEQKLGSRFEEKLDNIQTMLSHLANTPKGFDQKSPGKS
jgi:predicted  nucleic acid-binding Zn-ribbon protein